MLQIRPEVDGDGRTVVTVEGSIDLATASQLAEALAKARDDGAGIVVDLAGVDFMDSAGVRVLVEAARPGDGTLSVRGAQGWVARVLEITGVRDYLNARPDEGTPPR